MVYLLHVFPQNDIRILRLSHPFYTSRPFHSPWFFQSTGDGEFLDALEHGLPFEIIAFNASSVIATGRHVLL